MNIILFISKFIQESENYVICDKMAIIFSKIPLSFSISPHILYVCGELMDAFTEYDVRWQKDLSVISWRQGKKGIRTTTCGERKIGGKWKFRAKEAEKCSAVLVDRHALKKITVSSGILEEKEHTGEQIRKDTCGSQRNSAWKSIDSRTLRSLGFLTLMIFVG